ncbi:hypothetical protein B0H14DRAFT_2636297 [Mycena olivaceomarginata]|nr:hypothetical protein B0H14DRAFT_2636297 [Mycena olivaceomarginata]
MFWRKLPYYLLFKVVIGTLQSPGVGFLAVLGCKELHSNKPAFQVGAAKEICEGDGKPGVGATRARHCRHCDHGSIEDHRRGQLDEEVNTSPTTRLAVRNPNIPKDPRSLFEKLLGLNRPGAVSRAMGGAIDGRSVASTAHSYPPAAVLDLNSHAGAAQWERTLWKKLEVGDIVLLRDNEQVPADIIVLATSDPDGNCYLETKNLDGETNLKTRGWDVPSSRRTDGARGEGARAVLEIAAQPTHDSRRVADVAGFGAAPSNGRRSGVCRSWGVVVRHAGVQQREETLSWTEGRVGEEQGGWKPQPARAPDSEDELRCNMPGPPKAMAVLIRRPPAASTGLKKVCRTPPDHHT